MTTPAELFTQAATALFGDQFVAPLSAALDVDKNTVGKWRDGKSKIPTGVWASIEAALLARKSDVEIAAFLVRQQLDAARDADQINRAGGLSKVLEEIEAHHAETPRIPPTRNQ